MHKYIDEPLTHDILLCGCEHCSSIVEAYDDKQMELEMSLQQTLGIELASIINVGDQVKYYTIPHRWRHIIYQYNINIINETATKIHNALVISKTKTMFKLQLENKIIDLSFTNCFLMGMHKI